MKDKEMIEELVNLIYDSRPIKEIWVEDAEAIAKTLYSAGYRKIPKDSVVLSKEELAQKIYDDIFAILKIKLWLYGDDAMTKNLNGLTKQKILDFTKKWGIKDNHLNKKDYSHIDHLQAHDKQIKDQVSKETAETIIFRLVNYLKARKEIYKIGGDIAATMRVDWAILEVKQFAKHFGVEVKEN